MPLWNGTPTKMFIFIPDVQIKNIIEDTIIKGLPCDSEVAQEYVPNCAFLIVTKLATANKWWYFPVACTVNMEAPTNFPA